MYFELFEKGIVAFNEDGQIKTTYYDVHTDEISKPSEAHPWPVLKYELLTQPLEITSQLLLEVDNAAHMMLYKHMMGIFTKNETLWSMFQSGTAAVNDGISSLGGVIGSLQGFNNKIENLEKYFIEVSKLERSLIETKYVTEFSPLVNGIRENRDNYNIADEKEDQQNKLYVMMGKLRELNRVKVVFASLRDDIIRMNKEVIDKLDSEVISKLKTLSVSNSIVSQLESFGEIAAADLTYYVEQGNSI
jgi:hypothetical protein